MRLIDAFLIYPSSSSVVDETWGVLHSSLLDVTVLGDTFLVFTFYFCVVVLVFSSLGLFFNFLTEAVMAYQRRSRMNKRRSRRDFSRKSGTHKRNFKSAPMRGGIRL